MYLSYQSTKRLVYPKRIWKKPQPRQSPASQVSSEAVAVVDGRCRCTLFIGEGSKALFPWTPAAILLKNK